jgi:putative cardiolipin synthase
MAGSRSLKRPLIAVAVLIILAGCATLPKDHPPSPSSAWDRPQETRLGRVFAGDMERHPGLSGFCPLSSGIDAFVARMALAQAADRTLDLQYYIFHSDQTGKLILDGLLRASQYRSAGVQPFCWAVVGVLAL